MSEHLAAQCAYAARLGHHGSSAGGILAYVIGIILILGVFVSYGAQDYKIAKNRSSRGIAWLSILLANISTCSNSLNIILLRWLYIECCHSVWDAATCNAELLPVYQIVAGFISTFVFYSFLLFFFPRNDAANANSQLPGESSVNAGNIPPATSLLNPTTKRRTPRLHDNGSESFRMRLVLLWNSVINSRTAAAWSFVLYIALNIVACSVVGFVLLLKFGPDSAPVNDFAVALGGLSTVAIIIQWTPQIIVTWRAGKAGSLSIPMLVLQAPGSFLVVVFQLMYHESVSTWMPFFVTGVQQVFLLVLCVTFEIRDWRARRAGISSSTHISDNSNHETASLLSDTDT